MTIKYVLLLFLTTCFAFDASGQHKYEREYRIDREEAPEAVPLFMDYEKFER
ncbi:MAG: hypothetical protein AAF705_14605 [Bacteroidota bacterium]